MTTRDNSEDIKLAVALKKLSQLRLQECFDGYALESRPTEAQDAVLREFGTVTIQYIIAGNQGGKGATCARQYTWAMTDTHPYWKRPPEWNSEPLLCIVAGQTGKIIEHSILPKLTSLLPDGSYKIVRIGNITQELQLSNGNKFIMQSLENPNEARKRLQAYVAHFFWGDEQPPTIEIMTELEMRIRSKGGFGMYSFTPLVENIEMQRKVDAAIPPFSKKYTFSTLDNPLYTDPRKREALLKDMEHLPESVRRTRLYGDWSPSSSSVYRFDWDSACRPLPDNYSMSWRHLESVDPALKSALGLTVWAEDPQTGHWYLAHSEEISGIFEPEALVRAVQSRTRHYNIVRRVSDPHEVWYMSTAGRLGLKYIGVHSKNNRKGELIKQAQQFLGSRMFIPPHNSAFIEQLVGCKWASSEQDRIVSASSKHLMDSWHYAADNLPKWEPLQQLGSWDQQLYQANERRKLLESQKAEAAQRRNRPVTRSKPAQIRRRRWN